MPSNEGEGGFPGVRVTKAIQYKSGRSLKKVRLTKLGRNDNDSVSAAISTSSDGISWNEWEETPFGTTVTLNNQAPFARLMFWGDEGSVLYSKDTRGVNIGAELEIIEYA